MIARIILVLSLLCVLSGQNNHEPLVRPRANSIMLVTPQNDTLYVTVPDTAYISEEELFLREISDKALAKEEKRKVITNRILITIIAILLVDKFVK